MAQPQRMPSEAQIDAARRILSHNHQRTYALHSKGATIRAIQIALASEGYEPGRFDGDWGDQTQVAYDKYMRDHDQTWGSATPKALRFMSGQIGQPAPRARPSQPMDNLAVTAEPAPPVVTREFSPPAVDIPSAPNPSQSAEREYDPNVLHAATMNRNEPADMRPDYTPPAMPAPAPPAPEPARPAVDPSFWGSVGDATALAAGAPPTMGNAVAAQAKLAPRGFDEGRFDQTAPMTSDTGVPDNLVEAAAARQPGGPMTLRDALIQSGQFPGRPDFPAPNQMNILEGLRRALLADKQSKMAGY